eukprot:532102-Rhodomonas_salina.1
MPRMSVLGAASQLRRTIWGKLPELGSRLVDHRTQLSIAHHTARAQGDGGAYSYNPFGSIAELGPGAGAP